MLTTRLLPIACAVLIAMGSCTAAFAQTPAPTAPPKAKPTAPMPKSQAKPKAPPVDPALAEFLLGTWAFGVKSMKPGQRCRDRAFMMHFSRDSQGRLRREFANAGSLAAGLFSFGLTALRSDDYVTRVIAEGDSIEVDSWSSPDKKAAVRARLILVKEGDGLRYTSHGRYEGSGGSIAWSNPGINGGLYERCVDKPAS